jgi:hypothetical protein
MNDDRKLQKTVTRNTEHLPRSDDISVGQWYWVKDTDSDGKSTEWFGCVMSIGSNYIELHSPHHRGYSSTRVHSEKIYECLRPEKNATAVIQQQIEHYQTEVRGHLNEVREIMARLGVPNFMMLGSTSQETSNALVTMSHQPDIGAYKKSLVRAKDKQLPKLFEAIKAANEEMARWMTAESMPLLAAQGGLEDSIGAIKDRIFNVSIYAGLTEQVEQFADGEPASIDAKLHVFQRRLYMDEECLLDYQHGGMDFKSIGKFDKWLSKKENRDRIMPMPRSIVAMRVRRGDKEREWDGSLMNLFININLKDLDKLTFLYIRNGDRLYRLNTDIDFDELIFPDETMFDPGEPKMLKVRGFDRLSMKSVSLYEQQVSRYEKQKSASDQWYKDNPGENNWMDNPHRDYAFGFSPNDWEPFNSSSVYYDDAVKIMADRIKHYNRIALIIQGLFDRSPILHPHMPVRTWTPKGFAAAIELVYDGSSILACGNAPDFEEYRKLCNASLAVDSIVVGQEDYWLRREGIRESTRRDRDWREKSEYRPKRFKPHGNPGPGYIAKIDVWHSRSRHATFRWNREPSWRRRHYYKQQISTSIKVPASELFNISAYKPGDYKVFYRDARTRAQYLKWAPMLLAAEEYHAGNWSKMKKAHQ